MAKPIVLIDAFSLIFRAYHALQRTGMKSATGEPTFAVFAFANMMLQLLEKYDPDVFTVAFDTREPTFRHEMFPEYKAQRDAFPDDLVPQLERIKQLVELMGLPMVAMPGYEADDIVGTLARGMGDKGKEGKGGQRGMGKCFV